MVFLCCFSARHKGENVVKSEEVKENVKTATIISDKAESEVSQDNDWTSIIQRKLSTLDVKEQKLFHGLKDYDDLNGALEYLGKQYSENGIATGLQRLEPVLERLNDFSIAINQMMQAAPAACQLLWGGMLVLVKVMPNMTTLSNY
jgi:hypothetical protein